MIILISWLLAAKQGGCFYRGLEGLLGVDSSFVSSLKLAYGIPFCLLSEGKGKLLSRERDRP